MNLNELARSLFVFETVDVSDFQRRARVLQSIWRVEHDIPCGEHHGKSGDQPLGSRLTMPRAEETLENFLTEGIRAVVRDEVCDPVASKGKLYGKPRVFNDLLSSYPLCFNLFGELTRDLPLAKPPELNRIVCSRTKSPEELLTAMVCKHCVTRWRREMSS